tara:strand:- start:210 stop:518 length:309 start_codon:yes stop_codon:yes gene_type:complete
MIPTNGFAMNQIIEPFALLSAPKIPHLSHLCPMPDIIAGRKNKVFMETSKAPTTTAWIRKDDASNQTTGSNRRARNAIGPANTTKPQQAKKVSPGSSGLLSP